MECKKVEVQMKHFSSIASRFLVVLGKSVVEWRGPSCMALAKVWPGREHAVNVEAKK
jgi:hypothetical protein